MVMATSIWPSRTSIPTALVLLNSTVPGAATPNFAAKQDFTGELAPYPWRQSNLNGDGKLDQVVANFNANNVSVLLNTTTTEALPRPASQTNRT